MKKEIPVFFTSVGSDTRYEYEYFIELGVNSIFISKSGNSIDTVEFEVGHEIVVRNSTSSPFAFLINSILANV